MDIIRKLQPYEDCKLEVVTSNKTFHAILEFADPATTKIGLSDIRVLPNMKREIGMQVIFPADIISFSIIDERKVGTVNASVAPLPSSILSKKFDVLLNDDSESDDDHDDEVSIQPEEEEEGEFVLELPDRFRDTLPNDHVLIDCIDDSFHAAIKHIKRQDIIGISFEGNDVSRFGELSIVGVSSQWCTFLFDILVLKEDAFKKGLKCIFENPDIEKVIHDCVHPSDLALRLYDTNFNNLFDTRLGNVCIKEIRHRNAKSQDRLWTVRQCIEKYLDISREEFCIPTSCLSVLKGGPPDWNKRPLPYALRAFAIHNVIFMRELRAACIMNMLGEFYKGVNLLKNSLHNVSSESLKFGDVDLDMIFSGMNIKYVQMSDYIGGNKRNSVESYLHKIKDYEVFQPLPVNQKKTSANHNPSVKTEASTIYNRSSQQLRKMSKCVVKEETIVNNERTVQQRKPLLKENIIPKKEVIMLEENIIARATSLTKEDTISRAKLPVKESPDEFDWTTGEDTNCSSSTTLSLIPAGFSRSMRKRTSRKIKH